MINAVLDHTEPLRPHIITFWFKPEAPVNYTSGQFTEIRLPHPDTDERGDKRWFTLSSSPTEGLLSITTKFTPDKGSSFKKTLRQLKPGHKVKLADPMGDFVLPKDKNTPLLFIVGGMGITPVRSITKWLSDTNEKRDIHIIYGANRLEDMVFQDLFAGYGANLDLILTDPPADWSGLVGRIDTNLIKELEPVVKNKLVYITGPEPMTEALVDQMRELGMGQNKLVTDYFPGYPAV